jgi:hypothetical protein
VTSLFVLVNCQQHFVVKTWSNRLFKGPVWYSCSVVTCFVHVSLCLEWFGAEHNKMERP